MYLTVGRLSVIWVQGDSFSRTLLPEYLGNHFLKKDPQMAEIPCRNVLGGNFALVGVPSVGASGAIFGTFAVSMK